MWYTGKTRSRRKDLYSNVFIKVRFSLSRYCNKYLLWSLSCVLPSRADTHTKRNLVGFRPHQDVCHDIGICFTYWNLQTSEEEKILVIKHQTKKESQMVLCVFHVPSPWPVSPQNVYTVAFVYLLSFLQDLCSGIVLVQFKLCASLYGSHVQKQWGSLRPNLKSQMEMSHKTSISSPWSLLCSGASLGRCRVWLFVNLLCWSWRPFLHFLFPPCVYMALEIT